VLLNVLNVPTDVLLVKVPLISVLLVLPTDLDSMIVHVSLVCMKMLKNNVNLVILLVMNVLMLKLVILVMLLKTENLMHPTNVSVLLDIMLVKMIFVMLVTSDV
jgi:hypothetical protein